MSKKASEFSEMSDVAQASELVRCVVSVDAGASIGKRILATARKLGWSYSRTHDVWYEQARRIDAFEMDQLRTEKCLRQVKEARKAHAELTALIRGMEDTLLSIDADFHSETIAGLRHSCGEAAKAIGGMDRAGIDGSAARLNADRGRS